MTRCRCRHERLRGLVMMPGIEPARGVDVVPDDATDEQLAEMRAAGRLVSRGSDGPQDFDG